jgi:uncharacterized protein
MSQPTPVVEVVELFVYPLKSARGISVSALAFDARGPIDDRRWMLIDEDAQFLSQRRLPRMALLHVALSADALIVDAPGMTTLTVPRTPKAGEDARSADRVTAQVWNDTVAARPVSAEADEWFSQFLGLPCSLVTVPDDMTRWVDTTYAPAGRAVTFADAFPVLVVGTASVEELNKRLVAKGVAPVGIDRFRPNITVAGGAPHAEDDWRRLTGAEIALDIVKPCARCTIVAVDQARGARVVEPLKTLETYRRRGSKVYFGQNALHDRAGRLTRGELLEIFR